MKRHDGQMSPEDKAAVKASKQLLVKGMRCIECGSEAYGFRDFFGRPRLVEHTDLRTIEHA